MSNITVSLSFGALSSDIEEQLSKQKLTLKDVADYQQLANDITRLFIRGLLSESETGMARKRLIKMIAKKVQKEVAAS